MTPDAAARAVTTSTTRGARAIDRVGEGPARRVIRRTLVLVPAVLAVAVALTYLAAFNLPHSYYRPFTDANTYLAAGERLNAGHELYALQPGDRPVALEPDLSPSPLFSPPPIAVIWRPLAALPFNLGLILWIVAIWTSCLGTMLYVAARGGSLGIGLGLLLAQPAGQLLAVGNVAAFFPMLAILAWRWRDRPIAGAIIGSMTAVKIAPGVLGGWLLAERRRTPMLAAVGAGLAWLVTSLLFAGPASIAGYLDSAGEIKPSEFSLSAWTGIWWLSSAVLVVGTIAAALLWRRPALAFAVALVAATIGTPAFYPAGLAVLLGLAAPITEGGAR